MNNRRFQLLAQALATLMTPHPRQGPPRATHRLELGRLLPGPKPHEQQAERRRRRVQLADLHEEAQRVSAIDTPCPWEVDVPRSNGITHKRRKALRRALRRGRVTQVKRCLRALRMQLGLG